MSASSGYGAGGSTPVGPVIETLTGNNAIAVGPDALNNINIIGAGGVLVEGDAATHTLTITTSGQASLFTADDATTAAPSSGNINIFSGATSIYDNINTSLFSGNNVYIRLNDAIKLPNTNGAGTEGILYLGGNTFVHNFGTNNSYFGSLAGNLTGIGIENVGVGTNVLGQETASSANAAVGYNALSELLTGGFNSVLGSQAMQSALSAQNCVAIGSTSLENLTTGAYDICVGVGSGINYSSTESSNVILGTAGGTLGESNVMRLGVDGVGTGEQNALYLAGVYNRSYGSPSGVMQIDSTFKVGSSAGTNGEVLIGSTGASPVWATIIQGANILITPGPGTIEISATGSGGGGAVDFPTDDGNTAVEAAGVLNVFGGAGSSGINNIRTASSGNTVSVILKDSLFFSNTNGAGTEGVLYWGGDRWIHNFGANNVFVGDNAGNFTLNTGVSTQNVCIGTDAGNEFTTAAQNTLIGYLSGRAITTGDDNTSIGFLTLDTLETGSSNVAIGAEAGINYNSSESSNIVISNIGVTTESNVIRIGTDGTGVGQQDACYIAGIYNRDIGTTNAPVYIDSTGKLGTKESTSPLGNSSFFAQVTGSVEMMPMGSGNLTYFLGTSQAENLMWDDFGTFTNGPLAGGCFFTVPTDGIYQFNFSAGIFSTTCALLALKFFVNGVDRSLAFQTPVPGPGNVANMNNGSCAGLNSLIKLNSGDVLNWQVVYNAFSGNPIGLQIVETWVYGILLRPLT